MNEPPRVRRCVEVARVRQARRVGFSARGASRRCGMTQAAWSIRSELRESLQVCTSAVKASEGGGACSGPRRPRP
eukprot:6210093-Pleurochrysis_carterae.AAC.3